MARGRWLTCLPGWHAEPATEKGVQILAVEQTARRLKDEADAAGRGGQVHSGWPIWRMRR